MKEHLKASSENTLAQLCYEKLQKDIINGRLKPGEKLRVDPLKKRFAVGQSPIREALSRLVSTGLVEVKENRGFYVAPVSEATIRDTYATFTLIETSALLLAMEHGDAAWEKRIKEEFKKLELIEHKKQPAPYEIWAQQNYNFHQALLAGCNSPMLLDIQRNAYLKFDRYCRMAYHMEAHYASTNHDERKKHDHKRLMQAVLQRDKQKTIELINYHINGPLEDVINIFKKQKLI